MCGLVTLLASDDRVVPSEILCAMTGRLAHRGPDDTGYACIDARSGSARQWTRAIPPTMFNDEGSLAIVYNGEIYNYLELRRSLEQQGCTFRSHSDTEVLLKAYECW